MEFWDDDAMGCKPVVMPSTRPPARNLRMLITAALVVSDTVAIFLAFAVVTVASNQTTPWETWFRISLVVTTFYLISAFLLRAYSVEVIQYVSKSMNRTVKAQLGVVTILALAYAVFAEIGIAAMALMGSLAVAALALLLLGRWVLEKLISQHYKAALFDKVIVVDSVAIPQAAGFRKIDIRERGIEPNPSDPMMRHWAALYLAEADRVVVACPANRYQAWAKFLKGSGVRAEILMPELDDLGVIKVSSYREGTTVGISNSQLSFQNRILKRVFDIFFATIFIVVTSPIVLLCALSIKLDDGGPILFSQKRLGRGNRLFSVLKFRTMKAGDGASQNTQITRIGRILRSSSLDELPQLFNVLSGKMSLIGPRPHALESQAGNQFFWEVDDKYWSRHAMKPGITGLAQVRGYRGTTQHKSDLEKRLQSDLEYLNGWSVWRDLAILFSTVRIMVHKNAN